MKKWIALVESTDKYTQERYTGYKFIRGRDAVKAKYALIKLGEKLHIHYNVVWIRRNEHVISK